METILQQVGRYTRFVYSTKLTLVVLAAILACLITFYPLLKRDNGVRIAFTSIEKKGPGSPTKMYGAKFHGLDKSNQPYHVNAVTATQMDDNTVGLDQLTSDITLNSGAWLSMSSKTGVFKIKEQLLDLKGAIDMFDGGGYEFRTERLHVDVAKKTAVTQDEVDGQGPLGKLKAFGGAQIDSNRQSIFFEGPVFVTVYPSQREETQPTKDTGQ